MPIKSALFVPGDSERKLAKAADSDADLVIFDLEDAVVPSRRQAARELVRAALDAPCRAKRCVRVNPVDGDDAEPDLAAIMAGRPDYVMQPKVRHPTDIERLGAMIGAHEKALGIDDGTARIIALMTETPQMALALGGVTALPDRVAAITWGGEDLSAALGASTHHGDDGRWTFTYRLARSQTLLAARACGVLALDTLYADFRDADGLAAVAAEARRDGFDGMLAIHPAQVPVINGAFTPSEDELEQARQVVAAFEASPDAGAVQLDGRMLDRPHLEQARRLLARAERS